jgi:hypothetical protein
MGLEGDRVAEQTEYTTHIASSSGHASMVAAYHDRGEGPTESMERAVELTESMGHAMELTDRDRWAAAVHADMYHMSTVARRGCR